MAIFQQSQLRGVGEALRTGEWVTRGFGWLYMMISRLAGPVMTIAVGYLIVYAIESRHSLSMQPTNPTIGDIIANTASDIINVMPELVFPGTVVLCIQAAVQRRWAHSALYGATGILFAVLTLILLHAFQTNSMDDGFLAAMLLWRTISALFYTVVAEVCSHHHSSLPSQPAQTTPSAQPVVDLAAQINQIVAQQLQAAIAQSHSAATTTVQVIQQAAQSTQTAQPIILPQTAQAKPRIAQRPTPAQTPAIAQRALTVRKENAVAHTEPVLPVVTVTPVATAQNGDEEKRARVHTYILDYQRKQGKAPKLEDIMFTCEVAKNTASKYRRELAEAEAERKAREVFGLAEVAQ